MALIRWNPFGEMESLFDNPRWRATSGPWAPQVDISEDDDKFLISAEIPGVDKKDIKVHLENGTLTISGERKFEDEEKRDNYHRVERSYGSFCRHFTVPTIVDREKVEATMDRGILKVALHKKPEIF